VLIERISSRRQCPDCGRIYNLLFKPPKRPGVCDDDGTKLVRRSDDNVDVVRARLESYERLTSPIMLHYAGGDYHTLSANRPPGEIFETSKPCCGAGAMGLRGLLSDRVKFFLYIT
jgi:adenylate kinase